MTKEQLHALKLGDFVWVYRVVSYRNAIETGLGRVVEKPEEFLIKLIIADLTAGNALSMKELTFGGNESDVKFSACSSWDAERWFIDNAVEVKLAKQAKESEANFRTAVGFTSMFSAMQTVLAEQIAYDEPPAQPVEDPGPPQDVLDDEIPF